MNQPNPITHLTNEATKEALLARQAHLLDVQRSKVAALEEQVNDRLRALASTIDRLRDQTDNYPYGAFGADTATLDDLLKALAHESEVLRDLRAVERSTETLTEKYERLIADQRAAERQGERGQVIPMGGGQYL